MTEENENEILPFDLLNPLSFCVFDLETTGGNHKSDKIIEIGMVKVQNLEIVAQKEFLINPEIKIPEFIQKLTSITPSDVEDSPLIEHVIDEIVEFMGDSILVAHNTSFDIPFFNSVLKRLGREELENKSICTNLMTKYLIPNLLNSNLNYMCKIFNISHKKAHRALDDACATAELLINYLKIFINKKIQKINHLYYPRNRYELDRIHFKNECFSPKDIIDKLQSLKTPSLITLKGANGIILFSLPCVNLRSEKDLIFEKLENMDWKTVTIKLFGPMIETFVHFNSLYSKLEAPVRQEIMKHLWSAHLPNIGTIQREEMQEREAGDFLIANHLVPEQLIIFPIGSLHSKSQLIFRYPGHKKKMLQYINSKSSRIKNNKLKKIHFHPTLKSFVDCYLLKCKDDGKKMMIFNKNFPQKKPEEFVHALESFLNQNPQPYNYPSEYI